MLAIVYLKQLTYTIIGTIIGRTKYNLILNYQYCNVKNCCLFVSVNSFGEGDVFCYLADLVILTNYIRNF